MSKKLEKIILSGLFLIILIGIILMVIFWRNSGESGISTNPSTDKLPKFTSCSNLAQSLENARSSTDGFGEGRGFATAMPSAQVQKETNVDYSTTNIQVAGVDEADIVKTDGKYIYAIVGGQSLEIAKAYPALDLEKVAQINADEKSSSRYSEIYLEGERLVLIGSRQRNIAFPSSPSPSFYNDQYPSYGQELTFAEVYHISNPSNPQLIRKIEFDGTYNTSRKIDNFAYLVLNSYPNLYYRQDQIDNPKETDLIPQYRDLSGNKINSEESFSPICRCDQVEYFPPVQSNNFMTVVAFDINQENKDASRQTIVGNAENVFASLNNLYVTTTQYESEVIPQNMPQTRIYGSLQKTNIFKFNLNQNSVGYQGTTSVPGSVLNQFSMDEYDSYFRIATTQGHVSQQESSSSNNLYILDSSLKRAGQIENIAPGEKIYSARFMGKRGYLVTFKKVDPFFTLDLSNPKDPKILGKLKIPGYSDYLHPYDENHIIGLGKNTVEGNEEGTFAWYQGIKIALFDVTDPTNPQEVAKTEIGDRGTDSYALNDHKAFLFDKERELLVIPILLAEIPQSIKNNSDNSGSTYGDYVYQGAYVYRLTLNGGFELKGRISHRDSQLEQGLGYYYYDDESAVKRSQYIENVLYTFSDKKLVANDLQKLDLIKSISW